jgi:trk system potassium uptake protein TrkH
MGRKLSHIAPGFIVFLSFAIVILLGTLALMHPLCRVQVIPFIDLLLTATSATCVTGHFTMPLDHFTTIGHGVILALIQIGGLGLITLSVFLISLFGNLGLTTKFMAGQLLDLEESSNIRAIILFIVRLTLCVEFIGAVIFFMVFRNSFSTGYALFLSIFHSVSSFCNAGITLFDNSLIAYNTNAPLMLTTIGLMLVGGIGFITWKEIGQYIGSLSKRKRYTFSLHSKIILYGSAVMILWTTFLFLSIEDKGALASLSLPYRMLNSLFEAVAFRSTGFLTVPFESLNPATILVALGVAFIGSSPFSTGSGIKITTFVVMIATVQAALAGRMTVRISNRELVPSQVNKALAIAIVSSCWVIFTIFCLVITEPQATFFEIFVEAISSFTNLGLSTGFTGQLSTTGKMFIIVSMIMGRIGAVTIILALRQLVIGEQKNSVEYSYPEERIMLS